MYNYATILSYKTLDDTIYRKELLQCFNMTEYSDIINTKIYALYKTVATYYEEIIQTIKKTNTIAMLAGASSEECFMLLFSWEYFYDNHNLLNAISENKENIAELVSVLLGKINGN